MNWRHGVLHVSALGLAAGLAAGSAHAQARVGEAAVIQNQVVRLTGSASSQINVGDGLLRDEVVRTGLDSAARLVMADNTNLSLGPNATLKLDRTVFDDEHSYRDIAISLTTETSQWGKTTVVLQEGASRVCAIGGPCIELTHPGDTAVVTSTGGKVTIQKLNTPPWSFAANCAAAAGLCTVTQYADATPAATPAVDDGSDPTGMLCGR